MNRLADERSPYLRHAADQKIDWYPWSEEAFERARQEDKPVFLSSGAVWCHWCHVMAKECFFEDEIAQLLNRHFISIKLDRDERPDIDRRYQHAVAAMGSGGGWPLSVFLTPDKKPFFGGTYFPPEDSSGRPGFKKVLRAIIDLYYAKRDDVVQYTERLMDFIKPEPIARGEITAELIDDAVQKITAVFDPQNGGFGTAPKFPMPGTLAFMLNRYFFTGDEAIKYVVTRTLEAMAKGGFHDQLAGGFHRYSVDEAWIVPHFEKMADDNAWLLRNYCDAYAAFGIMHFRTVAEGVIRFIKEVLSDAQGGFYASQDADVTPDDEGGYFTWTEAELRNVLDDEEFMAISLHLFHERGAMHHDPSKRVLFVAGEEGDIAKQIGMDAVDIAGIIERGKRKLLKARASRETPFIDRTLYTSLNGMLIASLLKAYRVFGNEEIKESALKSLARIMAFNVHDNEPMHTSGIKALLDDYIYLIEALVAAYETTGDQRCLERAEAFMEQCIERFWDRTEGGFFDTDTEVLGVRLKGIEDVPHPSANATGIMLLIKLHAILDKPIYLRYAETALEAFATKTKEFGIHAGTYFCAVDAYSNRFKLTVEASPGSPLAKAALSLFRPYTAIAYGKDNSRIIPCIKDTCYEPLESQEQLYEFIEAAEKRF
ncbi:MAG: thioredoxin domain-containing protein [Nitrospirota bacterium]